jgi:DNA replication protein DnaC
MLTLKQENATDHTVPVIEDITRQFQAMSLPYLADTNLYLGMPLSILENFRQAIDKQCSVDEEKRFVNRLRYAGIVRERTSSAFQWDQNTYPMAEPGAIESVLDIQFVRQHNNLIVSGPPGAGKSLLAIIVACKAIRAGFTVKYKTAHDIATELKEAKAGNSLSGYIRKLQACDMLVIEDVIFATFDKKTAQSFFSVIDGRYGRKTTVITSNGNLNEWAGSFPDKRMCTALLGRFYENAVLVNMNGAEDKRLKRAKEMLENPDKKRDDAKGE